MSKQFSTQTLVLMAVAIAINIAVGYLVQNVLKIPIYLDSIGTVLVGALAGPLAGRRDRHARQHHLGTSPSARRRSSPSSSWPASSA